MYRYLWSCSFEKYSNLLSLSSLSHSLTHTPLAIISLFSLFFRLIRISYVIFLWHQTFLLYFNSITNTFMLFLSPKPRFLYIALYSFSLRNIQSSLSFPFLSQTQHSCHISLLPSFSNTTDFVELIYSEDDHFPPSHQVLLIKC